MAVRRMCLGGSLLGLVVLGCDGSRPVEPTIERGIETASTAASGAKINAPTQTSAVPISDSRIDVGWQDNSTNEIGFEVHRSTSGVSGPFGLLAATGAGVSSYSDGGLNHLSLYCYKVRAWRRTGSKISYSEFSATACATTPAPPIPPIPVAPSQAQAGPVGSTAIGVNWTDNSPNETGFRLERSTDGEVSWSVVAITATDTRSIGDWDRATEQQVCYRVIAINDVGESAPSNITCTAPPAAPTGLIATLNAIGGSDLSWTDNSNVEDGYIVYASDGWDYVYEATLPANSISYQSGWSSSFIVHATKDGGLSDPSNVADTQCAGPDCLLSGAVLENTSIRGDQSLETFRRIIDQLLVEREGGKP